MSKRHTRRHLHTCVRTKTAKHKYAHFKFLCSAKKSFSSYINALLRLRLLINNCLPFLRAETKPSTTSHSFRDDRGHLVEILGLPCQHKEGVRDCEAEEGPLPGVAMQERKRSVGPKSFAKCSNFCSLLTSHIIRRHLQYRRAGRARAALTEATQCVVKALGAHGPEA